MKLMLTAAMMGAERLEGLYACDGNRLVLHSRFGTGSCATGGIPVESLAEMMLRDQARLAALRAAEDEDAY
jgi:hypothetical protein